MKRLLLLLAFACSLSLFAQTNYTIDGKDYTLTTEVDGTITLLWTTVKGEYRYFSKKDSDIIELKNTKTNGEYQEEYKQILQTQMANHSMDFDDVKLTLSSLKMFLDSYNKQADPSYEGAGPIAKLKSRLGFFGGVTNYPFFVNPDNTLLPQIGVEVEIIDDIKLKRHSLVLQFRQLFATSDFDLSSSQLSLNYHFKFVKTDAVDIYINTKIAGYVYLSQDIDDPNGDGDTKDAISGSGSEFQAPFALGLGADIPLGNGFITVTYFDIYALNFEDNGDFTVDFAVGYKLNL
ncbi:MAG: hypothetical protein JKY22_05015 [Flavobacteriaceae bacterium]|nr:hypothetical protein [Flavobacteriaceae bacterium]